MCWNITFGNVRYNVIFGIDFNNAHDLLAGFDIRACAMSFDPSDGTFSAVSGAILDAWHKRVVFQIGSRVVSVNRLLKYTKTKNFTIDKYQRVIFAELIKFGKHSSDLELNTGYGVI